MHEKNNVEDGMQTEKDTQKSAGKRIEQGNPMSGNVDAGWIIEVVGPV
jgi:hypothetical protein